MSSFDQSTSFKPSEPAPSNQIQSPRKSKKDIKKNKKSLEEWKQQALSGENISKCPSNILPQLIDELKQNLDSLVSNGNNSNLESADKAYKNAYDLYQFRQKKDMQEDIQADLKERLKAAKKELANVKLQSIRLEKKINHFNKEQKKDLQNRQAEEYEKLIHEWKSPMKQRHYNRTSNSLRILRSEAILLLNAHRYDEMHIVEQHADQLEAHETAEMARHMELDYESALHLLQERHEAETEKLQIAQESKQMTFKAAKDFDIKVAKRKVEKLELLLKESEDPEKLWNLHSRRIRERSPPVSSRSINQRGKGRRSINVQEFNTLQLPPLKSPKSARRNFSSTYS